eukprot:g65642.t1
MSSVVACANWNETDPATPLVVLVPQLLVNVAIVSETMFLCVKSLRNALHGAINHPRTCLSGDVRPVG